MFMINSEVDEVMQILDKMNKELWEIIKKIPWDPTIPILKMQKL